MRGRTRAEPDGPARDLMMDLLLSMAFASGALALPPVGDEGVAQTDWATLGGSADRRSTVGHGFVPIDAPGWVLGEDGVGEPLQFLPLSGIAVGDGFGYAIAERAGSCVLVKIDLASGGSVWTSEVPPVFFDSWATPTLDVSRGTVLIAADFFLVAMDAQSGAELWRGELEGDAVNSSVAVTNDLEDRNRAFVVDQDSGGRGARLYCFNLDPFDLDRNPFEPGQLVWSVEIGGFGGTTPAYRRGRVYVATSANGGFGAGRIHAFDAETDEAMEPMWTLVNPRLVDFFGGVSVRPDGDQTAVYAASFAFDGRTDSANLVKLDAETGALLWSVPSNRTDSIPIVLDDGRIVLSTGLDGFGTSPMIQIFEDLGDRAALVWDSLSATWEDLNGDGFADPGEFLVVGGWNHQPIVAQAGEHQILYCGAIPTEGGIFGAYTDLYAIDLGLIEKGGDFLAGHFEGSGTTPAIAGGFLLSVGESGLHAFAEIRTDFDVNADGAVDIEDLYAWEQGTGNRDVDGDSLVTAGDRVLLIERLRRGEHEDKGGGRHDPHKGS